MKWYNKVHWLALLAYLLFYGVLTVTFDPDALWQILLVIFVSYNAAYGLTDNQSFIKPKPQRARSITPEYDEFDKRVW